MDAENVYEKITELPWGPGTVELIDELEISVRSNESNVEIFCEEFQLMGFGDTYEDALLDLAGAMESTVDDLTVVSQSKLTRKDKELLAKFKQYLPEEILE